MWVRRPGVAKVLTPMCYRGGWVMHVGDATPSAESACKALVAAVWRACRAAVVTAPTAPDAGDEGSAAAWQRRVRAVAHVSATAVPCVAFAEDKFGTLCRNLKLRPALELRDQVLQPVQLMQVRRPRTCLCGAIRHVLTLDNSPWPSFCSSM